MRVQRDRETEKEREERKKGEGNESKIKRRFPICIKCVC